MNRMPLPIIIDTNFLLIPAQFGIDVFLETEQLLEKRVEYLILESVVNEIRMKLNDKGFKIAAEFVKRCRLIEVDISMKGLSVDEQLLEYAALVNGVLATNDRDLREKARTRGIPVVFLRGKKRIDLDGTVV